MNFDIPLMSLSVIQGHITFLNFVGTGYMATLLSSGVGGD